MSSTLAHELDLTELEDEELARRASTDFSAFAELYRRYLCAVHAFMRAHVNDGDVAQDITAQVFFKALDSAATFRNEGSYAGWLFRIAHNCLATWRRDNRRAIVLDEMPEQHDPGPTPPAQVMVGEARELLWERVAQLPDDQREAIRLRYINDLSIEEVGREMRRNKGTVRVLLHRARAALRRSMGGDPPL
ncbi:MAG: sigma-70 family RNA polymerase sigma factor [Actinobacteria bacterium]|nr:sigma-70 family RNA polymerase sigma factor [Actinomycetota bacterium]